MRSRVQTYTVLIAMNTLLSEEKVEIIDKLHRDRLASTQTPKKNIK